MLKISGNAKNGPPIIRIRILPASPEVIADSANFSLTGAQGIDCKALLDTGADGTSVTRELAASAGLQSRGKVMTTGIGGQGYHRSWVAFLGLYDPSIGQMPYLLPEPVLAIEMKAYPSFDAIIGRDIMMLGDFILKSNGDFELRIPQT